MAYYIKASGEYCFNDIEIAWQAFLAAKRSMPVVELPEQLICYNKNGQVDEFLRANDVKRLLASAGIQYNIKE